MSTRRRRRSRLDPQVVKVIQEAALSPVPPAGTQLHRELELQFGEQAPSLRKVQMLLSEFQPQQPGKWWAFGDGDPEDDALVLPVLAELARTAKPARRGEPVNVAAGGVLIPQDTARWLVRIRTVAPEMPAVEAFRMAGRYAMAAEHNVDTRYLTLYLALELWHSHEEEVRAVSRRLIPANWWYVGPGALEAQS